MYFSYSPLIGNLSIKMNKLPLIVKSQNVPGYFDVANIVQNVFRSDLEIDVSHKPTLLNSEVKLYRRLKKSKCNFF